MALSGARRPFPSGSGRGGRRRGQEPPDQGQPRDVEREPDADPEQVARQICLHQLEHTPRTRAELAATLSDRGVPDDVAETVLSRFGEVGLIDDALFARMWVASRHRGKGLAGRALGSELRRKGVDDEHVREALDSLDPSEEAATARALVDRRLRSTRGAAPEARVRRLAGMLARKGYPAGLAFRVVKEALADEGDGTPQEVELDHDALEALDTPPEG
ncbi:MAG TPA: regulatory protein RecX [Mycobacteriales bacterium]|nr:regulatory protein RecX [Mycobacteriales bacterium]